MIWAGNRRVCLRLADIPIEAGLQVQVAHLFLGAHYLGNAYKLRRGYFL